jgi:hypothetical protein
MKSKQRQTEIVRELVKDPLDIFHEMSPHKCEILHPVLGIVGEVLEIIKAVKNKDRDNIIEEAGDLMFYLIDFRIRTDRLEKSNGLTCLDDTLEEVLDYLLEASERLLDNAKKYVIYNKDLDEQSAYGDICIIESSLLRLLRIEAIGEDYVRKHNNDKLKDGPNARYPSGYSDKAAKERADKRPN